MQRLLNARNKLHALINKGHALEWNDQECDAKNWAQEDQKYSWWPLSLNNRGVVAVLAAALALLPPTIVLCSVIRDSARPIPPSPDYASCI
jgi:hypothetical protein